MSLFGQIDGLPVHGLVVHAAVVAAPVTGLVGIACLMPKWRPLLRWPLVGLSAIALISVIVSRESGFALRRALGDQLKNNVTGRLVDRHMQLAGRLLIALIVLTVLAAAVAVLHRFATTGLLPNLAAGVVAVAAVGVLVLTYQVGDAGARARWNPDGSFDYSGSSSP